MKTLKLILILSCSLFSKTIISQADPGGNGCIECPSVDSDPCIPNASTWFLGGNNITGGYTGPLLIPPVTEIGTCNEFPFILKANNKNSIFILPHSYVGLGYNNTTPISVLDIKDGNNPLASNFRIYADNRGNVESTTDMTLNYLTGKSFVINEGSLNTGVTRLFMQNGKIGVNSSNPVSTLDIQDQSNAEIRLQSQTSSASSFWAINSLSSYNLNVDNSGIGHIGYNINSPSNLINFRMNAANNKAQVWVGKKPTTGNHVDFSFAVDGKLVANSMYVTLQGNWADFVFDSDYQLPSLSEIETFYKTQHHLPGIPSASEIKENGIDLEKMNTLLLQKIEELTLHLVKQQKEIDDLKKHE